jgi:hypothetical protein
MKNKVNLNRILYNDDFNKSRAGKIFALDHFLPKGQIHEVAPPAHRHSPRSRPHTVGSHNDTQGMIDRKQKELHNILMGVLAIQAKQGKGKDEKSKDQINRLETRLNQVQTNQIGKHGLLGGVSGHGVGSPHHKKPAVKVYS